MEWAGGVSTLTVCNVEKLQLHLQREQLSDAKDTVLQLPKPFQRLLPHLKHRSTLTAVTCIHLFLHNIRLLVIANSSKNTQFDKTTTAQGKQFLFTSNSKQIYAILEDTQIPEEVLLIPWSRESNGNINKEFSYNVLATDTKILKLPTLWSPLHGWRRQTSIKRTVFKKLFLSHGFFCLFVF